MYNIISSPSTQTEVLSVLLTQKVGLAFRVLEIWSQSASTLQFLARPSFESSSTRGFLILTKHRLIGRQIRNSGPSWNLTEYMRSSLETRD